jgi:hypothetical protein
MDITPSPRILRMLGEIEFDEWQCIAELVDNAFDDFTEILRTDQPWPGGYKVIVTLPGRAGDLEDAEVHVRDTGRGMTRQMLEQAVRAGWSSNDRFDKLGLFGMGFNVSTARLGKRTRVLTTRAGDPEWIGVEIDLETLSADFEAIDISEPKTDPSDHGTRIEVSNLVRARADYLSRNATAIRNTLGRVYGWLLDNKPFELIVQGVAVKPRRACRWGDDRFVLYGSGASARRIPAYVEIDRQFEPADACEVCGNWQGTGKARCDQCGSEHLQQRERRMHGWLGIQRHLDKREFGIDFLRNGRKILQSDKRLFDWRNPHDPVAAVETEYPVEMVHQGGRIIGEIHLDYVPVHYDKSTFEFSDRSWRAAVEYLRGEGPMLPARAKALSYEPNESPLARLVAGYRRNDPGRRSLIPGDGSRALHTEAREWANKFWSGDPDYQDDHKWWEQVLAHEERKAQGDSDQLEPRGTSADEDAVLSALPSFAAEGQNVDAVRDQAEQQRQPSEEETTQERLARYKSGSVIMQELSRDFGLPDLGNISVETRSINERIVDGMGQATPVYVATERGGAATAIIDVGHPAFSKLGAEPADLLLLELSVMLATKADSHATISSIAARLRSAALPDSAVDHAVISTQAHELLAEIAQRMSEQVADDVQRALGLLEADEQTEIENRIVASGSNSLTASLGEDGQFLLYAPPLFLVKLLEKWPEAFMDGRVFRGPWSSVSSATARRLSVARVSGYMNDIGTLLTAQTASSITQLRRTRLSVQLLHNEIAPDA